MANGDTDCGSRNAYEGTHYLHRNFYAGAEDPCLGTTPGSSNTHSNLGLNGVFDNSYCPGGSKDTTNLLTAITSNTMVLKFRFRTTGTWKGQTASGGGTLGLLKWIRLYGNGTGGVSDDRCAFVHIGAAEPGGDFWTIYSSGNGWIYFHNAPNINDGNWHSMSVKWVRLNNTDTDPNVNVQVWWDNWNMTGNPDGEEDCHAPYFGNEFHHIVFQSNFSGSIPASDMGLDIDQVELWNGEP